MSIIKHQENSFEIRYGSGFDSDLFAGKAMAALLVPVSTCCHDFWQSGR